MLRGGQRGAAASAGGSGGAGRARVRVPAAPLRSPGGIRAPTAAAEEEESRGKEEGAADAGAVRVWRCCRRRGGAERLLRSAPGLPPLLRCGSGRSAGAGYKMAGPVPGGGGAAALLLLPVSVLLLLGSVLGSADPAAPCPGGCSCDAELLGCGGLALPEVPRDLPRWPRHV